MKAYLDASVLIPLLTTDPFATRARAFLRTEKPEVILSDWARAEVCSAIARRARTGEVTKIEASRIFSLLDVWAVRSTRQIGTIDADVRNAEASVRRLDATLRAPDAIHIAIAQRVGAHLATFDVKMAASARTLGADVISL
jgi:predicted nucleic acid-binding protein